MLICINNDDSTYTVLLNPKSLFLLSLSTYKTHFLDRHVTLCLCS